MLLVAPTGALASLRPAGTERQDKQGGHHDQQAQIKQGAIPYEAVDAGFVQKTPQDEREDQCHGQTDQSRADEHAKQVDFAQTHHCTCPPARPGQNSSSPPPISNDKATIRSCWSVVRSTLLASCLKAELAFRPCARTTAPTWRPRSESSRRSAKQSRPASSSVWPPLMAPSSSPTWVSRSNIRASQRSVSGRRKSGAQTLARKPLAIRRLARQRRVEADAGGGSAEKAIAASPRPSRSATTPFSVASN